MSKYEIVEFATKKDLSNAGAIFIKEYIELVLQKEERISISLSGGSTPLLIYNFLSNEDIEWEKVDLFLGDERWVDKSNKLSNEFMVRNSLLKPGKPASKARFYTYPTTEFNSPIESSDYFNKLIQGYFKSFPPSFDLILLGLGNDGHTASLFPFSNSLKDTNRASTVSNGNGIDRITLTAPVLCSSKKVIFFISGSDKNLALKRLLDINESTERTPAKLVDTENSILLFCDCDSLGNNI